MTLSAERRPTAAPAEEAALTAALSLLDRQYAALDAAEKELLAALREARRDEVRLREALAHASESPRERRRRTARESDKAAVSRLESALLAADDSSEDEGGDDDLSAWRVDHQPRDPGAERQPAVGLENQGLDDLSSSDGDVDEDGLLKIGSDGDSG